jgi:hypothetical protein
MWHCYLVTEIPGLGQVQKCGTVILVTEIPGLGQVQKCGTVILVTEILASLKNISFFIKCVVSAIKDVLHIY